MDTIEYINAVRKRWRIVLACALLALGAAVATTLASTPLYESTTRLFFAVPGGESITDLAQGSSFAEKQMSSFAEVATSPFVLTPVAEELELQVDAANLRNQVRATVPPNTVIMDIVAVSTDPNESAKIANAVGLRLVEVVSNLYPTRSDGTDAVLATTLSPAYPSQTPANPDSRRNVVMGLILGLGIGVTSALILEKLDTRIRSTKDAIDATGRAVLGSVVYDADANAHPVVMVDKPNGLRAEAIRSLRTNLQFVEAASGSKTILVTSSIPDEGKTTTAVNLAVALADSGVDVLLIDADLRRPSVQAILGLDGNAGLTSVLIGRAALEEVVQPWLGGRVDVLCSGPVPPNPSELLGSVAMADLLAYARNRYDVVLIDTAPVLPVTDAVILGKRVDGTILLVGADKTHKLQLRNAVDALSAVDAHILGLVLNKVSSHMRAGYGGKYAELYERQAPDSESENEQPQRGSGDRRRSTRRPTRRVGVSNRRS